MYSFKAKVSKINAGLLCFSNISEYFLAGNMKKTGL